MAALGGKAVSDNEMTQENEEIRQEDEETAPAADGGDAGDAEAEADGGGEESLSERLAELEREKAELQDKMLRMAAELENFKKRMEREKQNAIKFAEENLLKELLPTIDNLERALAMEQTSEDALKLHEGVELTLKGLMGTVEKFGLSPIDSVGQAFDPNVHEAMTMEASDDVPAQHVITEFEKGYYYKDKLLRAAKVIVSSGADQ